MAFGGEDGSKFFSNHFTVVRPIRRVKLDVTQQTPATIPEPYQYIFPAAQVQTDTMVRPVLPAVAYAVVGRSQNRPNDLGSFEIETHATAQSRRNIHKSVGVRTGILNRGAGR